MPLIMWTVFICLYNFGNVQELKSVHFILRHPLSEPDEISTMKNSAMIIRTIGNALPPRHHPNATIANVKFILKHEVQDPLLQRHWLLSHIFDRNALERLSTLLRKHNESFSVLPFKLEEYAARPYRLLTRNEDSDLMHTDTYNSAWWDITWSAELFDRKILYAMNTNEARNFNIEYGIKAGVKWIMPWDQNCFLTRAAWESIKDQLEGVNGTRTKYFVTYMDRLSGPNDVLLNPNYQPNPWAEPQIIFRRDALERFHPEFNYARKDKASLILRLNVSGEWWNWEYMDWEKERTFKNLSTDVSPVYHSAPPAGWVARLGSGVPSAEKKGTGSHREQLRMEAIKNSLKRLDGLVVRKIHGFSSENLLYYDSDLLNQLQSMAHGREHVKRIMAPVYHDAENAMLYYLTSPEQALMSRTYDFINCMRRFNALALAWYVTGKNEYGEHARTHLHYWLESIRFLVRPLKLETSHATKMLNILAPAAYFFLDSVRLLKTSQKFVSKELSDGLDDFLTGFIDTSRSGNWGQRRFYSNGTVGLEFDLTYATTTAFMNRSEDFAFYANTVSSRQMSFFHWNGTFKNNTNYFYNNKLRRPRGNHMNQIWNYPFAQNASAVFNFWTVMGKVSSNAGVDVWRFPNASHSFLCNGLQTNLPCCSSSRCKVVDDYRSGWSTVAAVALQHCPGLRTIDTCTDLARTRMVHTSGGNIYAPPYPHLAGMV